MLLGFVCILHRRIPVTISGIRTSSIIGLVRNVVLLGRLRGGTIV
jgi:hypothetical protein